MTDKEKIELLDEFLELIPNKPNNYDLGESIRSIFIKRIGYSKSRSYTNQTRENVPLPIYFTNIYSSFFKL